MKKAVLMALAMLTLLVSATGCVGNKNSFCLFRGLAKWNLTMNKEPWVNEIVFLGLNIIPVYGLFLFADVLVFNSIDFWTGDNPVNGAFASTRGTDAEGNAYAIIPNGDGTATLTYKGQDCTLTRQGSEVAVSREGQLIGTFAQNGSVITFTGVDGTTRSALR